MTFLPERPDVGEGRTDRRGWRRRGIMSSSADHVLFCEICLRHCALYTELWEYVHY